MQIQMQMKIEKIQMQKYLLIKAPALYDRLAPALLSANNCKITSCLSSSNHLSANPWISSDHLARAL